MVYLLLGTGFEETEAIAPLDLLRRAEIEVKTVGLTGKIIRGSHGIAVEADLEIGELDVRDADMMVLPGGMGGVHSILACDSALRAIQAAYDAGAYIAAICAAPTILAKLHITDGKRVTCYPGCEGDMGNATLAPEAAVTDGKVITGTSAGCAIAFGLALITALKGPETAKFVQNQIVIR